MNDNSINILNQLISYITYFTIIIGSLGGFCNLLTFTSKQLRHNSCASYFLYSTIFDLIYLMFDALTRLMNDHYSYLLPRESNIFGRLRTYISVISPGLATFFTVLASLDRCLLTSNSRKWRNLSQIKFARYISIISIGFVLLVFSHILILYESRFKDSINNIYVCVPKTGKYTTFINIFLLVGNTILCYTIMLASGIITLVHVRLSRNRVEPIINQRTRFHSIDRHLITIMFFQVGIGMLFTAFCCSFLAYSSLTNNINKDIYRMIIESFLDQLSLVIYYMSFAKSFPVNTLTSSLFRNILSSTYN